MIVIYIERGRDKAEIKAEGEAGSMYREPDMGFDPGSPGSQPGPKAGAKPLCHPEFPAIVFLNLCVCGCTEKTSGLELRRGYSKWHFIRAVLGLC